MLGTDCRLQPHCKPVGFRVNPVIFGIFILQGALVAVGRAILTARLNAGTVSAGQNPELDVTASAVTGSASLAGDVGTVPRAMLGALVMASPNNGLRVMNVDAFWQYRTERMILVVAVYVDVVNKDEKGGGVHEKAKRDKNGIDHGCRRWNWEGRGSAVCRGRHIGRPG